MKTWNDERGAATIATVTAATLALTGFLLLATLVIWHYGRGVARTAVDEGVRVAAVHGLERCPQSVNDTLGDLLGGSMGEDLALRCWESADAVHAEVAGTMPAVLVLVPPLSISEQATRVVDPRG